ncbi:MAG: hypothetical protein J1E16_04220 [Muribaculaceae bacterium]|nr:hypothetical protein [Muribaculaceae bacterium]
MAQEIEIKVWKDEVREEVGKSTEYTGAKGIYEDKDAHDKYYAQEADLETLDRFWEEAILTFNERVKNMLLESETIQIQTGGSLELGKVEMREAFKAILEVSLSFDIGLVGSIEKTMKSYFISYIIGAWFKLAKKDESEEYFGVAEEALTNVERMLYSRMRPRAPRRS